MLAPYDLDHDLVRVSYLEVVIVEQCNLACRACSHLAPISAKWIVDVAELAVSLKLLSEVLHCRTLKVLGGEPLLHQHLGEIVRIVRNSGIADVIWLVSNGTLLSRHALEDLALFDQICISRYPGVSLGEGSLILQELTASFGMKVDERPIAYFQESYSELPGESTLVNEVYRTCKVAHVWGCYTLYDGYFFKCPQAYVLERLINGASAAFDEVGVRIDGASYLRSKIVEYLSSTQSLRSCHYCLGTSGRTFAHGQVLRKDWRSPQNVGYTKLLSIGPARNMG